MNVTLLCRILFSLGRFFLTFLVKQKEEVTFTFILKLVLHLFTPSSSSGHGPPPAVPEGELLAGYRCAHMAA